MPDLRDLLHLLYTAHHLTDNLTLEVRDWIRPETTNSLIAQTDATGKVRLHWSCDAPTARPAVLNRRVWFQKPARTRVQLISGDTTIRVAVQDGSAWWRWDQDDGELAGDLTQGAPPPPLLNLPLLNPARLLATMLFEVGDIRMRGEREVLRATAIPRETGVGPTRTFEFEFDSEHGTPLAVSTIHRDALVAVTEVLSVDYETPIEPTTFAFARRVSPTPAITRVDHLPHTAIPATQRSPRHVTQHGRTRQPFG